MEFVRNIVAWLHGLPAEAVAIQKETYLSDLYEAISTTPQM